MTVQHSPWFRALRCKHRRPLSLRGWLHDSERYRSQPGAVEKSRGGETDRQTDKQSDRQTDRQTGRQTDRQTKRERDGRIDVNIDNQMEGNRGQRSNHVVDIFLNKLHPLVLCHHLPSLLRVELHSLSNVVSENRTRLYLVKFAW